MTEVRRVQKFGRSTLMISLPSSWVKSVGLSPGDTVGIEVLEDGTLRLAPLSMMKKKAERVLKIKVGHASSETLLTRAIYAGYLLGMDTIVIESTGGVLSEEQLKIIRNTVVNLIGAEIIENTPNKITMQVLIDASKYSAATIISRMGNLVRFMIQHIETAILEGKGYLLKEVTELEKEVDRLHALTVRQLLLSQVNRSLGKYLGIKPSLATEYRGVVRAFEEASDALSEAAEILMKGGNDVLKKLRDRDDMLKECLDTLLLIVDRTDRSLKTMDPYLVNEVINLIKEYYGHVSKYNEMVFKRLGLDKSYLSIREFIDRLNEVSREMETIAETAFDIAIEKTGELLDISKTYV
ncbi:MAG: phosphate uptake regulator PhoU [Desulfurococcales archaeon]|nr:phosphate uptake regulator PhoU [Desulfurococcales archaeon]